MRFRDSAPKGAFPSKACSTIPSTRSPSDISWSSARPLRTLRSLFSRRTPVWTRSMVTMVPAYHGGAPPARRSADDLVGLLEQLGRKREAHRRGRGLVHRELAMRHDLDREVGGLRALQEPVHERGGAHEVMVGARAVA